MDRDTAIALIILIAVLVLITSVAASILGRVGNGRGGDPSTNRGVLLHAPIG